MVTYDPSLLLIDFFRSNLDVMFVTLISCLSVVCPRLVKVYLLQLLSPIKITGKKPINIILTFLTWSLYGPKPVTAYFWPIMEKLS